MCLCTVYGSHRVHLFKKPKTSFSLSSRFSQKLEKKVSAVHSEAEMFLFLCKAAAFSPRLGSGHTWGSCIQVVHFFFFGPTNSEGRASTAAYIQTGHFCSIWLWGPSKGPRRISRNRDTPQVWYQVLKLTGFALFQSRVRLASFNKTITIACVCVFVCS